MIATILQLNSTLYQCWVYLIGFFNDIHFTLTPTFRVPALSVDTMYSPSLSPTKQPRSSLPVQLMPRRRHFFLQILIIVQLLLSIASLVLSNINLHIGVSNDSLEELENGLYVPAIAPPALNITTPMNSWFIIVNNRLPFAEGRRMTWNQWVNSTILVITAACILTVCYLVFTIRLLVSNSRRTYYAPSVFTSGLVLAVRSWSVATICLAFMVYDLAITLPALYVLIQSSCNWFYPQRHSGVHVRHGVKQVTGKETRHWWEILLIVRCCI